LYSLLNASNVHAPSIYKLKIDKIILKKWSLY
jgi:hypothetical protein